MCQTDTCEPNGGWSGIPPCKFLQFNVGGADNDGYYKGATVAGNDIAESILAYRPAVVTLNEVCKHQAERAQSVLIADNQYPINLVHTRTIPYNFDTESGNSCEFGDAILTTGVVLSIPSSEPKIYPLAETVAPDSDERRHLTCAKIMFPESTIRACGTHLVDLSRDARRLLRKQQVDQVAGFLQNHIDADEAVAAGGDFNASPLELVPNSTVEMLDPIYAWSGSGSFLEAETVRASCANVGDTCEPTYSSDNPNRKIDYVFMDQAKWSVTSAETTGPKRDGSFGPYRSDNRLLKAKIGLN